MDTNFFPVFLTGHFKENRRVARFLPLSSAGYGLASCDIRREIGIKKLQQNVYEIETAFIQIPRVTIFSLKSLRNSAPKMKF